MLALVGTQPVLTESYTYNAWGELLSSSGTMADINPLRYRGYYYDTETGWYYLQSRYYDPILHRFINADSFASTGTGILGCNMFAYCNNNPMTYCDDSGHYSRPAITAINDGGSGLSSTELKYLAEILSLNQSVTSADDEYFSIDTSMSVTKNLLNVDANGIVHFVLDYQTTIGIAVSAASLKMASIPGFLLGTAVSLFPLIVEEIAYGGMPTLCFCHSFTPFRYRFD